MPDYSFMYRIVLVALAWTAGALLFWRLRPLGGEDIEGVDVEGQKVSLIVPARNEAGNIPVLMGSLQKQTFKAFEIILVDDNSTDETRALAEGYPVRILQLNQEPPPGWLGKSWACWQGYRQARGETLVFLDADVALAPDALERLLKVQRKLSGLVSVQPYHGVVKRYEHFSFVFNLVVIAAMQVFSAWGFRVKPAGAFGPCIICSREDYERAGTHAAVRGSLLEDIQLGKAFQEQNIPVSLFLGGDRVTFRMYPQGLASLVEGWSKNFASGAASLDPGTLLLLFLWVTGAVSSGLYLAFSGEYGLYGFVYLLFALQMFLVSRHLGSFGLLTAALYPLYFLFFVLVFILSLIRTRLFCSVSWRGRSIDLDGD